METGARHPYFVALFETAKAIHASLDLDEVLQKIVRHSADVLGVKAASLRLLDRSEKRLLLCAASGLSRDYLDKGPVLVDSSDIDRVALRGEIVVIADAARDARFQYRAEAASEEICSVLCVPLTVEGRGVGVLRVYSAVPRAFDQGEKELLTAMATLGALAIRNAEAHASVRNDLRELQEFVARPW